jgi:hypothetical protein
VVGHKEAPYLAVRDWRRAARRTALGGLLDGTLRLAWRRESDGPAVEQADEGAWEGFGTGDSGA